MLSTEQNESLSRVSPGTTMGNLMRRYWHLVGGTTQLESESVKAVRLLGESLVLYRDAQGRLGLLAESCPHRGASLAHGIIENDGLRCSYHGWLYDAAGRCLDQPLEPAFRWTDSGGRDPAESVEIEAQSAIRVPHSAINHVAYPVQELAGLIFAYLGPKPVPLLPRYNVLAWKNVERHTEACLIPCNWLQVMENLMDPMHVECLHRHYFAYVLERQGGPRLQEFLAYYAPAPMKKFGFDLFEHGIIERHITGTDRDYSWKIGTPTFFPTTSVVGSSPKTGAVIFVVPIDDTHTWFVEHVANRPGSAPPHQKSNRFYDVPGVDANGAFITDTANGQDYMVAVTQGDIAQREAERLATSDLGIVLYRQLLLDQMERVEHSHEPINVHNVHPNVSNSRMIDLPSPEEVSAHPLARQSARQRKRARHRQLDMLRQAVSFAEIPS